MKDKERQKLTFEQECSLIANGEDLPQEKQIEEMAYIIENAFKVYFGANDLVEPEDFPYQAKDLAKELLEHYQPKLPEDSVIISQKEYNALKQIEKYHIKSCGKDSVVLSREEYKVLKVKEKEKHWLETCMSVWRNAKIEGSKETAEKFLNVIYWKAVKHIKGKNKDECFLEISFEKLDEIAKQFGVEIKE